MTRAPKRASSAPQCCSAFPTRQGQGLAVLTLASSNEPRKLGGKVHVGSSLTPGALGTTSLLPCSRDNLFSSDSRFAVDLSIILPTALWYDDMRFPSPLHTKCVLARHGAFP